MASRTGKPPRHGDIRVGGGMKIEHAKRHLAELTASASEVADYGGHSVTGQASQGSFASGGAEGASYQTTNVGGVGDADTGGS
jgi:hypothetical protein